jgi:hypothetical protein
MRASRRDAGEAPTRQALLEAFDAAHLATSQNVAMLGADQEKAEAVYRHGQTILAAPPQKRPNR